MAHLHRTLRSRWRRVQAAVAPDRHSCLKCGFLVGVGGHEVTTEERAMIAAEGKAGWFQPDDPFRCAKNLWWHDAAGVDVIFFEANRQRPHCDGFHRWVHGRDPDAHFRLEDEARGFTHESRLAWRSFWGGLIGASLGAGLLALLGRLFE